MKGQLYEGAKRIKLCRKHTISSYCAVMAIHWKPLLQLQICIPDLNNSRDLINISEQV